MDPDSEPTPPRPASTALLYLDDWPWPARTGMRQRTLELVRALEAVVDELVIVCSSRGPTPLPVVDRRTRVISVRPGILDEAIARALYWWHRLRGTSPGLRTPLHVTPLLRLRLRRLSSRCHADVFVVFHARNVGAVLWLGRGGPLRVLDLPDLLLLNQLRLQEVQRRLEATAREQAASPGARPATVGSDPLPVRTVDADPEELEACAAFDHVLAVARPEADAVARTVGVSRSHWVPMAVPPGPETPRADDGRTLLFVASDSLFNVEGHLWLLREVLPVLRERSADFVLRVVGSGSLHLPPAPDVELVGQVDDLAEAYRTASVVLCPTLSGTGQPVKVVEAHAHGCPVVMTTFAAERTPGDLSATSRVASSGPEFAEHTLDLLARPALRRHMGVAARAEAVRRASASPLAEVLGEVLRRGRSDGGG